MHSLRQRAAEHYHDGLWCASAGQLFLWDKNSGSSQLEKMLESEDPGTLIRSLDPQALYVSLMQHGLERCGEVLALISADQFQRLCDFSVWSKGELQPRRMLGWLRLLYEQDREHALTRFRGLDEELQVATLSGWVRVFTPEDVERMSDSEQDALRALPGRALFYHLETDDSEVIAMVDDLLESAVAVAPEYAIQLLAHAAWSPPHEAEMLAAQFAQARLQEEGFIDPNEAEGLFHIQKWNEQERMMRSVVLQRISDLQQARGQGASLELTEELGSSASFVRQLADALSPAAQEELRSQLARCANAISAVTQVDPSSIGGLRRVLSAVENSLSLALDLWSGGDLKQAVTLVEQISLPRLHQMMSETVREVQCKTLQQLRASDTVIQNVCRHVMHARYGAALTAIDDAVAAGAFDYHLGEHLKAGLNRFPSVAIPVADTPHRYTYRSMVRVSDLIAWLDQTGSLLAGKQERSIPDRLLASPHHQENIRDSSPLH